MMVAVASGKGGTGKTTVSAALASVWRQPVIAMDLASGSIICDPDVDALDLHLLLHPRRQQTQDFYAGCEARIQPQRCDDCNTCVLMCRFDAVEPGTPGPRVNPLKCEGCKVCMQFCPADAISFTPRHCGTWTISHTRILSTP